MREHNCDIEPRLVAGPRQGHIKSLVNALLEGLGVPRTKPSPKAAAASPPRVEPAASKPVKFGPEDAELFAGILGHFAWHNLEHATSVVQANGVNVILRWLRSDDFTKTLCPDEATVVYPMQ